MNGALAPAAVVPKLPVHRYELRCGAVLLVSPRPGAPVCAVQAHLRGGHSLDPQGLDGVANLAGGLADQGTKGMSEEEIAAALETDGGSLNGDSTGLAGMIAGEKWKVLLEILARCLTEPTYPRDKFERQRRRLLDRLLIERDDPRTQGVWLFRRLVYGKHWLGRPSSGTLETVARIERRHVTHHHRREWCGRRAVIAFCGDVDPEKVRRVLDRGLARWNKGRPLPPPDARFPALASRVDSFAARRNQVHVYLGHLGIRRVDPDYARLTVMDHVLGTGPGFTSRITRKLRDELGLAYTVSAAIHSSAGVLPGTFTAYIGTSPEHVGTAVQGFQREIRRLQRDGVDEEELALAKDYLLGSFALGFERASQRVQTLVGAYRYGLPEGFLEQLVREFAEVRPEDVRRVAREHLHPEASCLVGAGPVTKRALAEMVGAKRR